MPTFYDTHAHLDFPDFAPDLPDVVERARLAGISHIITIGTDLEGSRRAIGIAERFPGLYAVVGFHPGHVTEAPGDIRAELRALARHPKVVAIGETGLDYYRLPGSKGGSPDDDLAYKARQAELFQQQLEVAAELGLNCVIHQRGDCLEDTLRIFEPFSHRIRAVFHCFSGDLLALERILAIGSLVSFTGILTFKNGQNVRAALARAPLGSFMLETDCPFLAPVPYRGKRCEPAYVKEIADVAAGVKGCSAEELSRVTCETAHSFFPALKG